MFGANDDNNQGSQAAAPNDHPVTPISSNVDTPLTDNRPPLSQPGAPAPDLKLPSNLHMDEVPAATPPVPPAAHPAPPADNNLLQLKQQAIKNLEPLVSHLDQTPEEKFKTTMMLIQASDNATLVKDAYEAAQKITDEKARAQALIDIVNEINYFTQHHKN